MEHDVSESFGFDLPTLGAVNASAAFNRLAGFEVVAAGNGEATIRMTWRDDFTQYSGHLHAGLIAALLDTACGFAAATFGGLGHRVSFFHELPQAGHRSPFHRQGNDPSCRAQAGVRPCRAVRSR
jgi:acyl-coenzyme A thioesterase PaaI-like protein